VLSRRYSLVVFEQSAQSRAAGDTKTEVVAFSHVGLGLAAEVDYPVSDVQLDRTASGDGKRRTQGFTTQAAGVYPGWDRFGRVGRVSRVAR
jgi:hypothetical protein